MSEQCKELISTLPKDKGWVASNIYNYQGFWCPVRHLQGVISCQNHFQPQDSDIFLVTVPKSGTTWLKALVFSLVHRARYPVNTKTHPLLTLNPHDVVPFLEIKLYADSPSPDFSPFTLAGHRVLATHLPYSSLPDGVRRCKMVYLCRNPKDIFVSLWQFTNKLRAPVAQHHRPLEEALDSFCRGVSLFGPVWDHVARYWEVSRENPDRVMFMRFEDIVEQPGGQLRRLADFLGCPFSRDEEESGLPEDIVKMCSFDHLSGLEVNQVGKLESGEENRVFFRRGIVGDWKNYLGPEMAEKIDRITEDKLGKLGLAL